MNILYKLNPFTKLVLKEWENFSQSAKIWPESEETCSAFRGLLDPKLRNPQKMACISDPHLRYQFVDENDDLRVIHSPQVVLDDRESKKFGGVQRE